MTTQVGWPETAPTVLTSISTYGLETPVGNLVDIGIDIEGYSDFLRTQGATDEQITDLCVVFAPQPDLSDPEGIEIKGYYTTNFRSKELDPDMHLLGRSVIVIHPEFFPELSSILRHETSHFLDRPEVGEGRRRQRMSDLILKIGRVAIQDDASLTQKARFLFFAVPASIAAGLVPHRVRNWHYTHYDRDEKDARNFDLQHIGQDFIFSTAELFVRSREATTN